MAEFLYEKTRLIYDISGEGTPIVFIHPPAMGRVVFRYQEELHRHFTVILPDLSGTGDSIGPECTVTIDGYAREVKALLEHLHIKQAVICGYSAGGCVAQEFALQFPDMTLGLILISGYSEVQSLGFKYEHLAGMYFVKKFPALLRYVISAAHTDHSSYRDEINRHMKKANRNMWIEFYEQSLYYNCTQRLPEISVPILLMYGSKDFSNQHLRSFEKLANHQAVIFPKVAHQLPTKRSQLVNQTITGFIIENIEKSH
ncbi:alpha/beta hydrolase [Niallia oryzisoli]|uniref:Alpha/beta hydrolase n=1 Tax=Niallia oryzisoli TaxID=1737571 RepID=A0ABZ2CJH5_9BACI